MYTTDGHVTGVAYSWDASEVLASYRQMFACSFLTSFTLW